MSDKVEKAVGAAEKLAETADKVADASIAGVKSLASAVEQVAPRVWEILCRQMVIEGITGIAISVLFCGLAVYGFKKLAVIAREHWDDNCGDTGTAAAVGCALCIIVMGGTILGTAHGVKKVVNPEYYAAEFLIEKAAKAVK